MARDLGLTERHARYKRGLPSYQAIFNLLNIKASSIEVYPYVENALGSQRIVKHQVKRCYLLLPRLLEIACPTVLPRSTIPIRFWNMSRKSWKILPVSILLPNFCLLSTWKKKRLQKYLTTFSHLSASTEKNQNSPVVQGFTTPKSLILVSTGSCYNEASN